MPLVIRLPAELEAGLRRLSDQEKRSQAEIVRGLISERVSRHEQRPTAFAVAQRLGVIGCDDDPRTDVATRHSDYVRAVLRSRHNPPRRTRRRGRSGG